jgi:hypothetical protein
MTTKLDLPFQLGEPKPAPGITLTPLFPSRDPVCGYVSLDEALAKGLEITEVGHHGDVGELAVRNPLDRNVLLYDGEELVGAKQNRILNVSVLLEADSTARIPVSCVERGRWSWRDRLFRSAGHVAGPELRRHKAASLRTDALARGIAQEDVWESVDRKLAMLGVDSPTAANSDGFSSRGAEIHQLARGFALEAGQCGVIASVAGCGWCLDAVSRPQVFARLFEKLVAGYAYDAIGAKGADAIGAKGATVGADEVFEALTGCTLRRGRSVALGEDVRIEGNGTIASGLAVDGELIQLSGYGDPQWQ